jgi:methylated-DNA-protein-cysteine methyltransferase related protein
MSAMDEARHERIREIVASIPEGRWASYGDVAAAAGERSARVVGTVLSQDGADLPWHRVLRTTGTPAPHIAVEQIRRLTAEGVLVVDARAAKDQRHRWPPPREQ